MNPATNKNLTFLVIALMAGSLLSFWLKSTPLEVQLINIAVQRDLNYLPLANESAETKAILLDYADNQALVLKAWIALKKYPKTAEPVFLHYGAEPEFKAALLQFGEGIIPVTDYFMRNEITTLNAQETVVNIWQTVQDTLSASGYDRHKDIIAKLSPAQRGWYAINSINQDGYNFLGQFAIDRDGKAQWLQSDRATKALTSLFTSGIRRLEEKYLGQEDITQSDLAWAGLDVFVFASSLKLLKASRAAASGKLLGRSGKSLSVTKKTSLFASKLIKNKSVQGLLKFSAVGATAYLAIAHPSLINSMLDEAAGVLGLQALPVKLLAWTVIIFFLLYPLVFVFNVLLRPLLWLAKLALRGFSYELKPLAPTLGKSR